ncbi:YfhO family protein [Bacillus sp. BRMEA1]|uniref:YfhO family protein n=1 Tax=Neobacillus endophyticus TaxID=2738405 RepID=UPI001567BD46|nr:YfhO family protein [Neobacillus endophyticus]NRD76698.1 YfhO family protein [Neobacillus endophyticus]
MIRKKLDLSIILLAALNAVMGFLIFYRILNKQYFYIAMGGDIFQQYIHFFNMFHDLVRSGEFPFWSWAYGPGGSFWNDYGYYMLGDIFMWPLLLLPKGWFPYSFIPISILKIFLISLGMYLLLKKLGVKKGIALMAGIANSYALFNFEHFYTHYFFLNATVYFPFVLLGYEKFLTEKKSVVLFVSLFLASISNFYFLFMISVGLFFYSIFRYFAFEKTEKKWKPFLIFHLKLSGVYLLALGSAMVVFLPSVFSFLQSSASHRHGQPITQNVLSLNDLVRKIIWRGGMNFLPLLTIPLLLINGLKRSLIYGVMGIVLVLMLVFQHVYSIVAGFSSPDEFRALFLFNAMFIILSAIALNELNFKKGRNVAAIFILAGLLYFWLDKNPFTRFGSDLKFVPVVFALFFVASQVVTKTWLKKVLFIIGAVAVTGYSLMLPYSFASDLIIKTGGGNPGQYHKGIWGIFPLMKKTDYVQYFDHPLVKNSLNQIHSDSSFYRINVNAPGLVFDNSSMSYDYRSFSTYQSLLKWKLQYFGMDYLGQAGSRNLSTIEGFPNNTFVTTILNNKYNLSIQTSDGSNLYGYKSMYQNGNTKIGKNQYALPIGFIYHSALDNSTFDQADYPKRDELLLRNVVVSDKDLTHSGLSANTQLSVKTIGTLSDAIFDSKAKLKMEHNGVLVESSKPIELSIPVKAHRLSEMTVYADVVPYTPNKGLTINAANNLGKNYVFEKNMKNNQYQLNQYNYRETTNKVLYRFGMDDQTKWIKLTIQPGKFLIKDVRVSISSYQDYKKLIQGYEKDSLKNITYGNNFINGTYTSSNKGILFLSIPYSSGWKATIDGKKVNTFPADYAFTGIQAPAGKHTVKLQYIPEGFVPGLAISLISLGAAILLLYRISRKKRTSQ